MLEFIVLGQIPGTSIQITYAQVIILVASILVAKELRLFHYRHEFMNILRRLISTLAH